MKWNRIGLVLAFTALLTSTILTTGCASTQTHVSASADVANAGAKIEQTGNAIFHATVDARKATPNLIPESAVDKVALAVNKLGHIGLDLEAALRAYSAAKASGGDVRAQKLAVQQLLSVVSQSMSDVGKALPSGTLQTVDNLVNQVLDIVAQVKVQVAL